MEAVTLQKEEKAFQEISAAGRRSSGRELQDQRPRESPERGSVRAEEYLVMEGASPRTEGGLQTEGREEGEQQLESLHAACDWTGGEIYRPPGSECAGNGNQGVFIFFVIVPTAITLRRGCRGVNT